jgi:hypothetical protein
MADRSFNPPYQLALDSIIHDASTNKRLYRFKQYGSHDFIKLSYEDIDQSNNIMRSINPVDLKQIHLHEYQAERDKQVYKVTCYLRKNEYIVANHARSERQTGEYIGQNLDKFKTLNPSDLWRMADAEGFARGKAISQRIEDQTGIEYVSVKPSSEQKGQNKVVSLKDYANKKYS